MNPSNFQYVKLIIITLFVMLSAISWAYRSFKAHQAKQLAKTAVLRRREQILRTGRTDEPGMAQAPEMFPGMQQAQGEPTVSVHEDARRKLQELATRRRRELEEMARRAAAGAPPALPRPGRTPRQAPPSPAAPARPRPVLAPARPITPPARQRSAQAGQRPQTQRRDADTTSRAAEARKRNDREQAATDRARVVARETYARSEAVAEARETAARAEADPMITTSPLRGGAPAGGPGLRMIGQGAPANVAEWRRLIAMMEVLGPPASSRPPDASGGATRVL